MITGGREQGPGDVQVTVQRVGADPLLVEPLGGIRTGGDHADVVPDERPAAEVPARDPDAIRGGGVRREAVVVEVAGLLVDGNGRIAGPRGDRSDLGRHAAVGPRRAAVRAVAVALHVVTPYRVTPRRSDRSPSP